MPFCGITAQMNVPYCDVVSKYFITKMIESHWVLYAKQ